MFKSEKKIVFSVSEPSKEVLWLHYKEEQLTLDFYGDNGWEPVSASSSDILEKIGNLDELTTEDKSSLVNAINEVAEGSSSGGGMVSITYSELKALRDNSQLVPGTQYRITNYECTTCQPDTRAVHLSNILEF